mmetsp:Transcript_27878/g.64770  ORF Transcript_27878/g.64770 Transcript_27878/m.64770 type:complete len:717 (+) Transcript_27878:21-2171(+)
MEKSEKPRKSPTLSFIGHHEEVYIPQVETPGGFTAFATCCKFGSCSLFDAKVVDVECMPFSFPAAQFLEETLAGMFGAPHVATPASKNWSRLQAATQTPSAQASCTYLAWVALGHIFATVSPDCLPEIKSSLAKSWFDLSLEVERICEGNRRNKDWMHEALPAVLVNAIYRMIVEAFPPEARLLAQHSQETISKLTLIVQHEVTGLPWTTQTWEKLRKKLFCPTVLATPQLNQKESMGAYLRRERREREQQKEGDRGPLSFGQPAEALSDEQLESVLVMRNERLIVAAQNQRNGISSDPGLALKGWTSAQVRSHLAPDVANRLEELAQRADEVSVDRYEELALEGEDMITRQLEDLYPDGGWEPGNTPPELVSKLGDEEGDPFSLNAPGSSSSSAAWPLETPKDFKRSCSQSGRSGRDSTVAAKRERERREAEAAERRRREELLEKCLLAPLPKEFAPRSFETSLVSPALDRLSSSEGTLLPALKNLRQKVRMQEPKPHMLPDEYPPEPSRSAGSFAKPKALRVETRRASHPGPGQAKGRLGSKGSENGTSQGQSQNSFSGTGVSLALETTNVKEEVTASRMEKHMTAFRDASFDNMKKDFDILTGQKKQRLDAVALDRDEKSFVERMEGLVGSKSTPAVRQLNPFLKKSKSVPKLLGNLSHKALSIPKPVAEKPKEVRQSASPPKLAEKPKARLSQAEVRESITWDQLTAVKLLG